MGDETINLTNASDAQALAELEAEFQRELERNSAALQLLKERAEEAKCAKTRAELSHQKMECMKIKYNDMHDKLERSRRTLQTAQDRIDRQNQVTTKLRTLTQKADLYESKLKMHNLLEAEASGTGFDFPQPLINYDEEEAKEREQSGSPTKIDYARTVLDLQEKLSRVQQPSVPTVEPSQSESSVSSCSSKAATNDHEEVEEVEDDALAIDLNESVQRLEAKCAGVREELGRMALSEQYMRTKQAQLKAKKKEKEAEEAVQRAEQKEREALEMRRKVAETMRLLQAKRDRIKATCKIIEKKEATTEKVNKILHKGQRREAHITKQKEEELVFGKPKPDDKKEDKQEDKQ